MRATTHVDGEAIGSSRRVTTSVMRRPPRRATGRGSPGTSARRGARSRRSGLHLRFQCLSEIAVALFISEATVKTHVTLLTKLRPALRSSRRAGHSPRSVRVASASDRIERRSRGRNAISRPPLSDGCGASEASRPHEAAPPARRCRRARTQPHSEPQRRPTYAKQATLPPSSSRGLLLTHAATAAEGGCAASMRCRRRKASWSSTACSKPSMNGA